MLIFSLRNILITFVLLLLLVCATTCYHRKNLILTNVIEERYIDSSDYTTTNTTKLLARRELSQAMIPGSHLLRVEIDQSIYESHMRNDEKISENGTTNTATATEMAVDDNQVIDTAASTKNKHTDASTNENENVTKPDR